MDSLIPYTLGVILGVPILLGILIPDPRVRGTRHARYRTVVPLLAVLGFGTTFLGILILLSPAVAAEPDVYWQNVALSFGSGSFFAGLGLMVSALIVWINRPGLVSVDAHEDDPTTDGLSTDEILQTLLTQREHDGGPVPPTSAGNVPQTSRIPQEPLEKQP